MHIVVYEHPPEGRRCYVLRLRIHHGLVGLALFVIGLGLIISDWRDRWWFHDLPKLPISRP